jgi:hypothetical protein
MTVVSKTCRTEISEPHAVDTAFLRSLYEDMVVFAARHSEVSDISCEIVVTHEDGEGGTLRLEGPSPELLIQDERPVSSVELRVHGRSAHGDDTRTFLISTTLYTRYPATIYAAGSSEISEQAHAMMRGRLESRILPKVRESFGRRLLGWSLGGGVHPLSIVGLMLLPVGFALPMEPALWVIGTSILIQFGALISIWMSHPGSPRAKRRRRDPNVIDLGSRFVGMKTCMLGWNPDEPQPR